MAIRTDYTKTLFETIRIVPALNGVFPHALLSQLANARNVDERLLQHRPRRAFLLREFYLIFVSFKIFS